MSKASVSAYNRKYYKENKASIVKHRRNKYHTDADFRARTLAYERAWRLKKRKEMCEEALKSLPAFNLDGAKYRLKYIYLGDKPVLLYSTAAVAHALHIHTRTVAVWADKGVLPSPVFVSNDKRRWFDQAYIDKVYKFSPYLIVGVSTFAEKVKEAFDGRTPYNKA